MNEKNFNKYFKTFRDNDVLDHNIFNRLLSDLRKNDYIQKMESVQITRSKDNIDITLKYTDSNDKKVKKNIVFEGLYKRLK
jgi:ribosomal protein S8